MLRTQRNMRIHFARRRRRARASRSSADVTKLELIALLLAIAFVLIAEMINTAIEGAIDVATSSFDPMAKLAKDIAAGAVLIAAINAVAVGYLVFSGKTADQDGAADRPASATRPPKLTIVALVAHRDRRDRDQGLDGPRHAAARRAAVGPRRDRVRRLDRAHLHRRRRATASSSRRSRSCWRCSSRRRGSSPASTPRSRCARRPARRADDARALPALVEL